VAARRLPFRAAITGNVAASCRDPHARDVSGDYYRKRAARPQAVATPATFPAIITGNAPSVRRSLPRHDVSGDICRNATCRSAGRRRTCDVSSD
jgi:hypothetical protein